MAQLAQALPFFAPNINILVFPAWDCLPYDRVSPNTEILSRRLDTLATLAVSNDPIVLITTISAILQKVPKRATYEGAIISGAIGDSIVVEQLLAFLEGNGYIRAGTVREPGEYAVRGDIVDIFPPGAGDPVRLDFFGDELEGVRSFDAMNQRTIEVLESFSLRPVSEVTLDDESIARFRSKYRVMFGAGSTEDPICEAIRAGRRFIGMEHWLPLFHDGLETLFDYRPDAAISMDQEVEVVSQDRFEMIADYYDARVAMLPSKKRDRKASGILGGDEIYKPVPPDSLFIDEQNWAALLAARSVAILSAFDAPPSDPSSAVSALRHFEWGGRISIDFAAIRARSEVNIFEDVKEHLAGDKRRRTLITASSRGVGERLERLLSQHGVTDVRPVASWPEFTTRPLGAVSLAILDIEHGFARGEMQVLTEQDILGERMTRPTRRRRKGENFLTESSSLSKDDLVVHEDHGIGQFDGLETVSAGGAPHDCLRIIYAGGDKLYVPAENIEVLSRFGSENATATLDRLGAQSWQARKARVKERIRLIAGQLIKVAAERAVRRGEVLNTPDGEFQEFCARFPFSETEDQGNAISDVTGDMASGRPMDRLICGDVGFGKTEVALRAAFVAAMNGVQVAVVVPTTLLALQHFKTFRDRFNGLPIRVAQLSRFVSAKDAEATRQEMQNGTVDIVIGTHALLSKTISFANLGLLVVDEEQHFGVAQKERLKQLKANVHILTLTATPIPRTLQMALSGVRELSIIATAPVDRLAVRTFVMPFDSVVVREAIMRERHRGGQTFYVCPRVADLARVERRLKELVPDIKVAMAHGQMTPSELEDVMIAFFERRYDILLCTQIVESGLDIPTVNTMIIHRADMFGLAQLYQLRGRIGRSKTRAYCYLTIPPGRIPTPAAQKRLEVMQTLDTLGAGFTLASHDLDIRGAGNLLGDEQSGHIKEVGVELYQQMLEEAVAAARNDDDSPGNIGWSPQIALGAPVLIPERFVSDLSVRLGLYRRLSGLGDAKDIESFAAELIDRFGALPEEVENLLRVISIKQHCRRAGIAKVDAGPKGAVIGFRDNVFANPAGLIGVIQRETGRMKLRPDHTLFYQGDWNDPDKRISGVVALVSEMAVLASP
ncbi:MAG: transcription-repair coupling factor (superfamily II helicase) [Alphaproteobacteria bacterium]|jgi:transcription-repair coupling factor (superfamily II helicase)